MTDFSPREAKKSLLENVSLLHNGTDYVWAEFCEVESLYAKGYVLVNELKNELYTKIKT